MRQIRATPYWFWKFIQLLRCWNDFLIISTGFTFSKISSVHSCSCSWSDTILQIQLHIKLTQIWLTSILLRWYFFCVFYASILRSYLGKNSVWHLTVSLHLLVLGHPFATSKSWGFLLHQLCKRQLFCPKFNCWL